MIMVENLWIDEKDFKNSLEELVYRSNILGKDRSIVNWGGGNTSVKSVEQNFKGENVDVLWVKGSGSDLATMTEDNFTALNLNDIEPLKEKEDMLDEDMVSYLSHCMLDSRHPRSSIETLLHAFLPYKHVDHTHPDAIISIACADNGKEIAEEIYGDRMVWVPYIRPGFKLSKLIADGVANNKNADLVVMEKHGLVTWGDTSKESYDKTIEVIQEAEEYIRRKFDGSSPFGGAEYQTLESEKRKDALVQIMPIIRGNVSAEKKMIVAYNDSEEITVFVNSAEAKELSQVGAACPDHLVHTKRTPLYIEWNPQKDSVDHLKELVQNGIKKYKEEYIQYFERNSSEDDEIMEPLPRVILIPGIGMINTGKSWSAAKVSDGLYQRAISVMKGTYALGKFVSLNESESFAIEYWPLELYKLSLAPAEAEFSGKVAFVTGGAGGIGSEACKAFLEEGAHVIVADINLEGAEEVVAGFNYMYGENRAYAVKMDVTKEQEVIQAIESSILQYGGIDVLVNNAGLASSSPLEETTMEKWNLNIDVLLTGYFLVAREIFSHMKNQDLGGSMVFVGSKNSIYAGKNNTAYSTAKAAEVHLARTIAVEGGEFGIRVNSVLPDAVIKGSKIWDSKWKNERASSYGIDADDLEDHYKERTILKENVLPSDIAETIRFLASKKSAKTTGCMITVDGGVAAAFTR